MHSAYIQHEGVDIIKHFYGRPLPSFSPLSSQKGLQNDPTRYVCMRSKARKFSEDPLINFYQFSALKVGNQQRIFSGTLSHLATDWKENETTVQPSGYHSIQTQHTRNCLVATNGVLMRLHGVLKSLNVFQ